MQIVECCDTGTWHGMTIKKITVVSSSSGFSVTLMSLGATITSVVLPDRSGILQEVTLGHDDFQGYFLLPRTYFGATIGRVANRIARGECILEGTTYRLAKNDRGIHCLHGGHRGFDQVVWDLEYARQLPGDEVMVTFSYRSEHMEEGFPGTLSVQVTYLIKELTIDIGYRATTDRTTIVNLTNHTYWNLEGLDRLSVTTCLGHRVCIHADAYLPVDETLIPTGEIAPVGSSGLDVRTPKGIGEVIARCGDIDLCYVPAPTGALRPVAEVYAPGSGRVMTVTTDQPGLQWYTGNFLEGVPYRGGVACKHLAFCLEAQGFPDAIHHPHFPQYILTPDTAYLRRIVYSFASE